jgi:hypothetical protein
LYSELAPIQHEDIDEAREPLLPLLGGEGRGEGEIS